MTHSKYWTELNKLLDISFPKGECQERGRALFLVANIDMLLSENQFTDVSKMVDPKPTEEQVSWGSGACCKPQEAKVDECKHDWHVLRPEEERHCGTLYCRKCAVKRLASVVISEF